MADMSIRSVMSEESGNIGRKLDGFQQRMLLATIPPTLALRHVAFDFATGDILAGNLRNSCDSTKRFQCNSKSMLMFPTHLNE
jgi:hypothetical protein